MSQHNASVRHSVIQDWVPQRLTELPAFGARLPLGLLFSTCSISSWLLPQNPAPTHVPGSHLAAHLAWFYLRVTPNYIAPDGTIQRHCDSLPAKPFHICNRLHVQPGHKTRLTSQSHPSPKLQQLPDPNNDEALFCSTAETRLSFGNVHDSLKIVNACDIKRLEKKKI